MKKFAIKAVIVGAFALGATAAYAAVGPQQSQTEQTPKGWSYNIQNGQRVAKGDTVVVLEAMKLLHALPAPVDGTVVAILCSAGQTVAFDTDSAGTDTDTVIRLFDNTGTQIAFNDDGQGPGELGAPLNSYLVHTFSQAGTYYLGVSGFTNSNYNVITGLGDSGTGRTGSYQLAVRFNA